MGIVNKSWVVVIITACMIKSVVVSGYYEAQTTVLTEVKEGQGLWKARYSPEGKL